MSYSIYKLQNMIEIMDEKKLRSLLKTFKCSAEPSAEHFLNNIAVRHEKADISRTYIALEANSSDEKRIKGFFTLAIKCLSVNEPFSVSTEIFEQMNVNRDVAQAYLLGQLAKADDIEKGFGKVMIKRALGIFTTGKEMFGCKVVRLDCKDSMIGYYESLGFIFVRKNIDNTLNQMIAII